MHGCKALGSKGRVCWIGQAVAPISEWHAARARRHGAPVATVARGDDEWPCLARSTSQRRLTALTGARSQNRLHDEAKREQSQRADCKGLTVEGAAKQERCTERLTLNARLATCGAVYCRRALATLYPLSALRRLLGRRRIACCLLLRIVPLAANQSTAATRSVQCRPQRDPRERLTLPSSDSQTEGPLSLKL